MKMLREFDECPLGCGSPVLAVKNKIGFVLYCPLCQWSMEVDPLWYEPFRIVPISGRGTPALGTQGFAKPYQQPTVR